MSLRARTPVGSMLIFVSVCLSLSSCASQIQGMVQAELNKYWSQPAKKAAFQSQAKTQLHAALKGYLVGQEFDIKGPNPYVKRIKQTVVNVGTVAPDFEVLGNVQLTQTGNFHYGLFDWQAHWEPGNGARLVIKLELKSHAWYLFKEYPDHKVTVKNIDAVLTGSAVVMVPASLDHADVTVTVDSAAIDLRAEAKGWFWTINISNQIKSKVRDLVLREVIGKAIERGFDAALP